MHIHPKMLFGHYMISVCLLLVLNSTMLHLWFAPVFFFFDSEVGVDWVNFCS